MSIFTTMSANKLWNIATKTNWRRRGLDLLRRLPRVAQKISEKKFEFRKELEKKTFITDVPGNTPTYNKLPDKGLTFEQIFPAPTKDEKNLEPWEAGKASGAVYHNDKKIKEVTMRAIEESWHTNPLHLDAYKRLRTEQAEIISMTKKLFGGDKDTCGSVTSGGTESILLACLSARNRGLELGLVPEIIIPTTAHAAFRKAGHYFGIKIIQVPVDRITFQVKVEDVEKKINENTVLVVGSLPQFPHGVMDSIKDLSDMIGRSRYKDQIGLHGDACLGSFLLPFMKKAGYPIPPFRFDEVENLTSISVDTHKYGFGPKEGGSVLLHRKQEWMNKQIFKCMDWEGGYYATPTLLGSRSGALIHATHKVMLSLGEEGYLNMTKQIIETAMYLKTELQKLSYVKIMGDPLGSVIAFQSNDEKLDIYALFDALKADPYHWHLTELQNPPGIHFCITAIQNKEIINQFIADVNTCAKKIMENPAAVKSDTAALYGEMQKIPNEFADEFVDIYWDVKLRSEPTLSLDLLNTKNEEKSTK
jgi:sphinganine-1-phosphate aldolase